jgi:hypothetical protein
VLEGDEQIKRFLTLIVEYSNMNIDSDEEDEIHLDTGQLADHFMPKMIRGNKVI